MEYIEVTGGITKKKQLVSKDHVILVQEKGTLDNIAKETSEHTRVHITNGFFASQLNVKESYNEIKKLLKGKEV